MADVQVVERPLVAIGTSPNENPAAASNQPMQALCGIWNGFLMLYF